jgi:hypothetical protein
MFGGESEVSGSPLTFVAKPNALRFVILETINW